MSELARDEHSTFIVGGVGSDFSPNGNQYSDYNSAMLFGADGARIGRYDKIHLVPFGEYIPFKDLIRFAHKLTGKVSDFSRGTDRAVWSASCVRLMPPAVLGLHTRAALKRG